MELIVDRAWVRTLTRLDHATESPTIVDASGFEYIRVSSAIMTNDICSGLSLVLACFLSFSSPETLLLLG